jgi:hypothetical protein
VSIFEDSLNAALEGRAHGEVPEHIEGAQAHPAAG